MPYGPDARTHAALARLLGLESAVPREAVVGRAGSTGTAACLLGLAATLEAAEPHQPTLVREERQNFRLYGQRCEDCGAVSYPRRHLCWQCSSTRLVDHRLARRGKVFTFTRDHLVPSPDPPTIMAAADLEGGGRFYAQVTDVDPATVDVDMPVELTFRRLHEGEDYVNYFWKLCPA